MSSSDYNRLNSYIILRTYMNQIFHPVRVSLLVVYFILFYFILFFAVL